MEVILPGQIGLVVPVHVVKGPVFATERVQILLRLMAVKTASENHSIQWSVQEHHVQVRIPLPARRSSLLRASDADILSARHAFLANA